MSLSVSQFVSTKALHLTDEGFCGWLMVSWPLAPVVAVLTLVGFLLS